MDTDEIQEVASDHKLDVREIQEYHLRLMNNWGVPIVDVYVKKRKSGTIMHNSILYWKSKKWFKINNQKQLISIIKYGNTRNGK